MRALLVLLLLSAPGVAAECPAGNLLAGRKATTWKQASKTGRLTDGVAAPEGDFWKTNLVTVLRKETAHVTWDLGEVREIRGLTLQGDNNDEYVVSISTDRRNWTRLWTAGPVDAPGLRGRDTRLESPGAARYLRLAARAGDGSYSVSELQVFCELPAAWPPKPKVEGPGKKRKSVDMRRVNAVRKMRLALAGAVVFLAFLGSWGGWWRPLVGLLAAGGAVVWAVGLTWGPWAGAAAGLLMLLGALLSPSRGPRRARRLERLAMLAVLVTGGLSWTNFGRFHGSRAVHLWDTFHYYAGSKYFAENRYTRLYHCAVFAELDDGRRPEMDDRKLRDLRDNSLGPAARILDEGALCREHFTPDRWAAWQQDIRLFRAKMGADWFRKMFNDHGYNATPVWTSVGRVLASVGWRDELPSPELVSSPANKKKRSRAERRAIAKAFKAATARFYEGVQRLALIDGALYVGIFLMLWWAFGLRATALAALVFGVGYPWDYHFTGGSFGRVPWMFMATAGLCLLKRGYSGLGAAGLATSALLRVFPGALFGGVGLKILGDLVRERRIARAHLRFLLGAALATGLLVGVSAADNGGPGVYREFIDNSLKHKHTRLTNHMGLPTLFSWHPDRVGRFTKDEKLDDPWAEWKRARIRTLNERRPLWWGSLAALLGLIGLVGVRRKGEDWEVTALSAILVAGIFELTCYYYLFVLLLVPLASSRARDVLLAIAMAMLTQQVHLKVGWYDEQYTLETLVVFGWMLYVLLDRAFDLGDRLAARVRPATGSTPPDK